MDERAFRALDKRMNDGNEALHATHIERTASIVSAYVSHNHVQTADLTALISSVHAAIGSLGKAVAPTEPEIEKPIPAQIRRRVTDDALIGVLDGTSYKTLKRHLTGHGLDPRSDRERFGLAADYPMVAPSYAAQRSALAKQIGLGRAGAAMQAEEVEPAPAAPKTRGRRAKDGTAA